MDRNDLAISVIVTTYNNPNALRLVLLALADQDVDNFEVIVADDGSDDNTSKVIEDIKVKGNYKISHIWQPHDNFRAAMIRNKAAAAARGEYFIFLDGDTIPQGSFIRNHRRLLEPNYFVFGNRILLSSEFTQEVFKQNIALHHWTWWQWFNAFYRGKINRFLPMLLFLGRLYWRYFGRRRWQGAKTCNLGVWQKDFIAVNGFDENYYGWGYEDSDLVVRLIRNGVLRKDGRFMIPVIHLWHPQNARSNERDNYKRLEATISSSHIKAGRGVDQYTLGDKNDLSTSC